MLLSTGPLEVNRVFRMQIDVPDDIQTGSIQFGAESLWLEPGHDAKSCWAGFQIIDISVENNERICRLIDEYL